MREQAVWGLGNIAADAAGRDMVLKEDALPLICEAVRQGMSLELLRNSTWAISNLCRGKPPSDYEKVKPALTVLPQLIYNDDPDVIIDTCWALTYFCEGKVNIPQGRLIQETDVLLLAQCSLSIYTTAAVYLRRPTTFACAFVRFA